MTRAAFGAKAAAQAARRPPVCAVSLIDRRTGRLHRINGAPLILYTRQPGLALSELMERRDPARWLPQVERLGADPVR